MKCDFCTSKFPKSALKQLTWQGNTIYACGPCLLKTVTDNKEALPSTPDTKATPSVPPKPTKSFDSLMKEAWDDAAESKRYEKELQKRKKLAEKKLAEARSLPHACTHPKATTDAKTGTTCLECGASYVEGRNQWIMRNSPKSPPTVGAKDKRGKTT